MVGLAVMFTEPVPDLGKLFFIAQLKLSDDVEELSIQFTGISFAI